MIDNAKIHEALRQLKVEEDNHWTNDGLPRIDVVAELSGIKYLKRGEITAAAPAFTRANAVLEIAPLESQAEQESPMLVGSSVQPSTWELPSGETLMLGDVVSLAFENSGMTHEQWNEQPDEQREAHIAAVVADFVPAPAPDAPAAPTAPEVLPQEPLEASPLEVAQQELKSAQEILASAQAATLSAQKAEAAAQKVVDRLLEEIAVKDNPRQNQLDIMQFIASQQALREQRVATMGVQRSQLDQVMMRKTGHGQKRPLFNKRSGE